MEAEEGAGGVSVVSWESLPDEVLGHVASFLSLQNRGILCQVSHRFDDLLTSGSYGMPDIAVLNLFQEAVWRNNVHDTAGSKIRCVPLKSAESLQGITHKLDEQFVKHEVSEFSMEWNPNVELSSACVILRHVSVVNSLKLWFRQETFVRSVLDILRVEKLRLKCLDVYPYTAELPLELVREKLPDLSAMTLRPHGEGFFWDGLSLPGFPQFAHLDTLVLDSVNLGMIPKLRNLPRLEYLLLGHVDFAENDLLRNFLDVCSGLPELHFLVFRFVKFPGERNKWVTEHLERPLGGAKVIKLDLCYGDMKVMINELLDLCNPGNIRILSLNWLYEDLELIKFYEIIPTLQSRQISLQFGLLQKNTDKLNRNLQNGTAASEEKNSEDSALPFPPTVFRDILWKLDMSFLEDTQLLKHLLSAGIYWQLIEMKFVNCSGVDDQFLEIAAKNCPRLRKITLSRCDKVTGSGVNQFLLHWHARKVRNLHVMWRHKGIIRKLSQILKHDVSEFSWKKEVKPGFCPLHRDPALLICE